VAAVTDPVLAAVAALLVGLCVGSFLNVVIHRLPRVMERSWRRDAIGLLEDEQLADCAKRLAEATDRSPRSAPLGPDPGNPPRYNLVVPRSACPACGHRITAFENVPVLSWLLLRGKCSACRAPISARYPAVELLGGLLALAAILAFGPTAKGLAACILLWTLLALTVIDADTQLLPDSITLPLLWAGLVVNLWGVFVPLPVAVIGAVAGYLSLWAVYWLFKLIRGKEGMGFGDFKLLAALGAWLGWPMLPVIVLLSSLVGAVVGIALIALKGRDRSVPIPFGPYLAAAGAIALFFGPAIVRIWLPAH
jgi:leader peptidase (prepilin peptidase)/N-methyltransferase